MKCSFVCFQGWGIRLYHSISAKMQRKQHTSHLYSKSSYMYMYTYNAYATIIHVSQSLRACVMESSSNPLVLLSREAFIFDSISGHWLIRPHRIRGHLYYPLLPSSFCPVTTAIGKQARRLLDALDSNRSESIGSSIPKGGVSHSYSHLYLLSLAHRNSACNICRIQWGGYSLQKQSRKWRERGDRDRERDGDQ